MTETNFKQPYITDCSVKSWRHSTPNRTADKVSHHLSALRELQKHR